MYDAQADNAKQATDLSSAINSGAKAIIIDHGFPATIQPEIDKAVKKGIKVVVYDVETATKGSSPPSRTTRAWPRPSST